MCEKEREMATIVVGMYRTDLLMLESRIACCKQNVRVDTSAYLITVSAQAILAYLYTTCTLEPRR